MIELIKPYGGKAECDPDLVPAERLEAEICSLAGHLAAATCRLIDLIADYDERNAWARWEMRSCAEWLSWKCQMSPGTAREHVRVGRALRTLPVLHREFAVGRMSYSKIRELTRIATPDTEASLAEMTTPMTASQVERFARAYHQCTDRENQPDGPLGPRRRLKWRTDPDTGEMSFTIQLPPADGAVVLQALRAALGDLDHPHDAPDLSSDNRPQKLKVATEDLADALVEVSGNYLRGKITAADNADIYQVIVHTTPDVLGGDVPDGTPAPGDVPDGTRGTLVGLSQRITDRMRATHPCRPGRCHLEDGSALDPADARLIACDATISSMTHDSDGSILNVGRRTRKVPPAIRRAVRERDGVRCAFPGCESRRVDLHHIQWWSNGGETSLDNLMNLCRTHHRLVHRERYLITRGPGGYTFTSPDGTRIIAPTGNLPTADGPISTAHQADVNPHTIQQASGEHLDLHLAIWIALQYRQGPRKDQQFYNIAPPAQRAA